MDQLLTIQIPADLDFADLKLSRDPVTLDIEFNWAPIEAICKLSGVDPAIFCDGPEDNLSSLVHAWYLVHLERGGEPDPVQEQLRAEVEAEFLPGGHAAVINHGGGIQ